MFLLERTHDPSMLTRWVDLPRVNKDVSPVKTACAPEPLRPPYLISSKRLPSLRSLTPLPGRLLSLLSCCQPRDVRETRDVHTRLNRKMVAEVCLNTSAQTCRAKRIESYNTCNSNK